MPPVSFSVDPNIALEAKGLGKVYFGAHLASLFRRPHSTTAEARERRRRGEPGAASALHALCDVSFSVHVGGALGVIGRNGAGKSSLLRILAGISPPSEGTARVSGESGNLLDLGAGLVEELSGEQNARLLLGVAGVPAAQIEDVARRGQEFAELGGFWSEAVRTYSAGMRLRLAYGLVVALEPRVLIADEILSVGDEAFQRRCSRHITRFLEDGGTLVFATHNLYQMEKLCDQAVWLEQGRIAAQGRPRDVAMAYRAAIEMAIEMRAPGVGDSGIESRSAKRDRPSPGTERKASVHVDHPGTDAIETGQPFSLRVELGESVAPPGAQLDIIAHNGTRVGRFPGNVCTGGLEVERCPLLPGHYLARVVSAGQVIAETPIECRGERRELGAVVLTRFWG